MIPELFLTGFIKSVSETDKVHPILILHHAVVYQSSVLFHTAQLINTTQIHGDTYCMHVLSTLQCMVGGLAVYPAMYDRWSGSIPCNV